MYFDKKEGTWTRKSLGDNFWKMQIRLSKMLIILIVATN